LVRVVVKAALIAPGGEAAIRRELDARARVEPKDEVVVSRWNAA